AGDPAATGVLPVVARARCLIGVRSGVDRIARSVRDRGLILRPPQIPRAAVGLALAAPPRAVEAIADQRPRALAFPRAARLAPVELHHRAPLRQHDPPLERAATTTRIRAANARALLRQRDRAVTA